LFVVCQATWFRSVVPLTRYPFFGRTASNHSHPNKNLWPFHS